MLRSTARCLCLMLTFVAAPAILSPQQTKSSVAKQLEGSWITDIPGDRVHHLQLRIETDSSGHLTCALDQIEEGVANGGCENLTVNGNAVSFATPLARSTWRGHLDSDKHELVGRWTAPGWTDRPTRFHRQDSPLPVSSVDPEVVRRRGHYGPYRANNDLLSYKLHIRVEPDRKFIRGDNQIRFRTLVAANRIQLDLYPDFNVDDITMEGRPLHFQRELGAVYIDFPEPVPAGSVRTINFAYSGFPKTVGRFGGMSFNKDSEGNPWIVTACEDDGSSIWWPSKDQWRDEPQEGMDLTFDVPSGLTAIANGRLVAQSTLPDGFARWTWHVSYPINHYDVSVNIGKYAHWSAVHRGLNMDYYALPRDLEKAKVQFAQTLTMMDAFRNYLGEYPFIRDGYKLIEVDYTGMEHQSAVTYGGGFCNGYSGNDWTGVGISPRFDFLIIHESGHEWFGNSISSRDPSDMWIHEGFDTYAESLYVEYRWGKQDALRYLNGYRSHVANEQAILRDPDTNSSPDSDQYFKGALFLNTLRSIIADDARWFRLLRDYCRAFRYKTILTEDVIHFFNQATGLDLTPEFNQYLRHKDIPKLVLRFDEPHHVLSYRWQVAEQVFRMPVKVGAHGQWRTIVPSVDWQTMPFAGSAADFQVATDLFYIEVDRS